MLPYNQNKCSRTYDLAAKSCRKDRKGREGMRVQSRRVQEMGVQSRRVQSNSFEMSEREQKRYARIMRLRRERRRKCLMGTGAMIAVFCLIMACAFSYSTIRTNANDGYKYYTRITVGAGESLWELSDDYMDDVHYDSKKEYIAEVCSINHLEDADGITAGQSLVVPYYSSEYIK